MTHSDNPPSNTGDTTRTKLRTLTIEFFPGAPNDLTERSEEERRMYATGYLDACMDYRGMIERFGTAIRERGGSHTQAGCVDAILSLFPK